MLEYMQMTYGYDDITLVPSYSDLQSRQETDISMFGFNAPIMTAPMDVCGPKLMNWCVEHRLPFVIHRAFKSADEQWNKFIRDNRYVSENTMKYVWFSVGSSKKYKDWIDWLYACGVRMFCVDMAHGDCLLCVETIKYIKSLEHTHVIAGNVATGEGFARLEEAGADGIRVGIAAGSICSTAKRTAFGIPIITSLIDCVKARKNEDTWIIADGGIRNAGDIAKAMHFGADFCMCGKIFASTIEADGQNYSKDMYELTAGNVICESFSEDSKIAYKSYHGMASSIARQGILSAASVEGVEGLVKCSGHVRDVINGIEENLKAALSYAGARSWDEFRVKTFPVLRSTAGIVAADTHLDVHFK